jgi:hypothetical protein
MAVEHKATPIITAASAVEANQASADACCQGDSKDNFEHDDRYLDLRAKEAGRQGRYDSQHGDQNQ